MPIYKFNCLQHKHLILALPDLIRDVSFSSLTLILPRNIRFKKSPHLFTLRTKTLKYSYLQLHELQTPSLPKRTYTGERWGRCSELRDWTRWKGRCLQAGNKKNTCTTVVRKLQRSSCRQEVTIKTNTAEICYEGVERMKLSQNQMTDFWGEPSDVMTALSIFTSFATITVSGEAL
jgi:hypothetical protein